MESEAALTLERRQDGIAVITIDVPGESQNVVNASVIEQLERLLDELEKDRSLKGTVFISSKPGSFIAGADIHMLAACRTASAASELARRGQRLFDRVDHMKKPVVAAIDGVCLGGGLELALACHGRLCTDDDKTRLGLPEVQLGLLPGSGGTQRLPRLIGITKALELMLTGRHLRPKQAKKLGLVDAVVPASILLPAALKRIHELQNWTRPRHKPHPLQWTLKIPQARKLLFDQVRKRTRVKTKGNYPAPDSIIACVEHGMAKGFKQGLSFEAERFGELAMTAEARQLMNLYFATTEMKKDSGVDGAAEPLPVTKAAVLGAGLMGAGISYVTTNRAETPVRLKDKDTEGLSGGMKYINRLLQQALKRRHLTRYQAGRQLGRVTPALDYSGFHDVDLAIEAVFEDLTLKQQIVRDIEENCHERTIFASNTSSIPIQEIASSAQRPGNVIGMHYFSPVEKMPLLEVIATEHTSPQAVATAVDFGRKQGKTVIVVKDAAGFYVNRILAPYINEAAHMLTEGMAIDAIDRAMVKFGFPVGPFTLLDEVGIDVVAKVGPILNQAFGDRMQPAPVVGALLKDGRLGKKSKRGFYSYEESKKKSTKTVDDSVYALLGIKPSGVAPDAALVSERLILPLLNEAARCGHENIIRSPRDGDIGAVFGIGFPPFRGGPFRYMDSLGIDELLAKLKSYQQKHGQRFAPADALSQLAAGERTFYSES